MLYYYTKEAEDIVKLPFFPLRVLFANLQAVALLTRRKLLLVLLNYSTVSSDLRIGEMIPHNRELYFENAYYTACKA